MAWAVASSPLPKHWRKPWPVLAGPGRAALCGADGGEPLLQVDAALIDELHAQGFEVAVETNGTLPAPEGLD